MLVTMRLASNILSSKFFENMLLLPISFPTSTSTSPAHHGNATGVSPLGEISARKRRGCMINQDQLAEYCKVHFLPPPEYILRTTPPPETPQSQYQAYSTGPPRSGSPLKGTRYRHVHDLRHQRNHSSPCISSSSTSSLTLSTPASMQAQMQTPRYSHTSLSQGYLPPQHLSGEGEPPRAEAEGIKGEAEEDGQEPLVLNTKPHPNLPSPPSQYKLPIDEFPWGWNNDYTASSSYYYHPHYYHQQQHQHQHQYQHQRNISVSTTTNTTTITNDMYSSQPEMPRYYNHQRMYVCEVQIGSSSLSYDSDYTNNSREQNPPSKIFRTPKGVEFEDRNEARESVAGVALAKLKRNSSVSTGAAARFGHAYG